MKRIIKFGLVGYMILLMLSLTSCNASNDKANELINTYGYTYKISSLKTPKGSKVITWKYTDELSKEYKQELIKFAKEKYPNAKKLREPTLKYNCHSYAWHGTSKKNTHWINDPSKYWTDKSYSQYASSNGSIPNKVTNNSKVVYWDGNKPIHSGIVHSSTKIRSKWGMGGLYEHNPKDCPYPQYDEITYKLTFYK